MAVADGESTTSGTSAIHRARGWFFGIVAAYAATILVALRHLRYGVDVWDEGFYVALAYRFIRGDVAIRDEIDPHQFGSLLASPLYAAFLSVTHSTRGIIFFARASYLLITLCVVVAIIHALGPVIGRRLAAVVCVPLVIFAPMGIMGLSYNSIAALGFVLSCVWATRVALGGPRWMAVASGVASGVCVVAYPAMIVAAVALQGSLAWTLVRRKERGAWLGPLGLAAVGAVALLGLLWVGLAQVAQFYRVVNLDSIWMGGLPKLLQLAYFTGGELVAWPVPWLLAGVAVVLMRRRPAVSRLLLVLAAGATVLGPPSDRPLDPVTWSSNPAVAWGVVALVLFVGVRARPIARTVLVFLVVPSIVATVCMSYSSALGLEVAGQGMLGAVLAAGVFSAWTAGVEPGSDADGVPGVVAAVVVLVFLLGTGAIWWQTPRHDLSPSQLTARVDGGPWDGLYTIPARAEHLEDLQQRLGHDGPVDERAVLMSGAPGVYLILQSRIGNKLLWMTQPGPTRTYAVDQMYAAAPPDLVLDDTYLERPVAANDVLRVYLDREGFSTAEQGPNFVVYRAP